MDNLRPVLIRTVDLQGNPQPLAEIDEMDLESIEALGKDMEEYKRQLFAQVFYLWENPAK